MTESNPSKATITLESLRSCRWAQAGEQVTHHALSERLRALAQEAEKDGAPAEALALDLLSDLCRMGLDNDGVSGPFSPFFQSSDGARTLIRPERSCGRG